MKHRENDLPALIHSDKCPYFARSLEWWINDKRHREKGPAHIYYLGPYRVEEWYDKSKEHRTDDLPSITIYSGDSLEIVHQEWHVNGMIHRENNLSHS